jgi:hypothetical protein
LSYDYSSHSDRQLNLPNPFQNRKKYFPCLVFLLQRLVDWVLLLLFSAQARSSANSESPGLMANILALAVSICVACCCYQTCVQYTPTQLLVFLWTWTADVISTRTLRPQQVGGASPEAEMN